MAYLPLANMATVSGGGPVQENAGAAIRRIVSKELLDGELIEGVSVQGGSVENKLRHKLNRKAKGFVVTKRSGDGDIWGAPTLAGLSVYTSSSSALKISLWVF